MLGAASSFAKDLIAKNPLAGHGFLDDAVGNGREVFEAGPRCKAEVEVMDVALDTASADPGLQEGYTDYGPASH